MTSGPSFVHPENRPASVVGAPQVVRHLLEDDGTFPNNDALPMLSYPGAVLLPGVNPAAAFEELFHANGWGNAWRNGVYSFHHYHSTAHEVLGVYSGTARLQLGGESGILLEVGPGDVLILPAGVAHKNLGASDDFRVVGAYPHGQRPDTNQGRAGERPRVDQNIAALPLPETDPVYGEGGPLMKHWSGREREEEKMDPILVAYATRSGSTQEVAEQIAATLRESGIEVSLQAARQVQTLEGYSAVILGAPLYLGRWLKDARRFLRRHQASLAERPVVLFALGPLEDTEEQYQGARGQLDKQLARFPWLKPVEIAMFGGVFNPARLGFPFSMLPATKGQPASDIRDWEAIRAWASGLVAKLRSTIAQSGR